jgi:cell division protein FtsL
MIKELTSGLIEKFSLEFNKNENKIKVQKQFLDPVIVYITKKMFPYFIIIVILFFIISILSIINCCVLFKVYLK